MATLSSRSGSSAASTTQVVDNLERDGMVKRERDQDDRRVVFVAITEKGKSLIQKLIEPKP